MNDDLRPETLEKLHWDTRLQKVVRPVFGDYQFDIGQIPVLNDLSAQKARCTGD
jgi:hypothetical protein